MRRQRPLLPVGRTAALVGALAGVAAAEAVTIALAAYEVPPRLEPFPLIAGGASGWIVGGALGRKLVSSSRAGAVGWALVGAAGGAPLALTLAGTASGIERMLRGAPWTAIPESVGVTVLVGVVFGAFLIPPAAISAGLVTLSVLRLIGGVAAWDLDWYAAPVRPSITVAASAVVVLAVVSRPPVPEGTQCFASAGQAVAALAWAPGGDRLAFATYPDPNQAATIWSMSWPPSGPAMPLYAHSSFAEGIGISPEGAVYWPDEPLIGPELVVRVRQVDPSGSVRDVAILPDSAHEPTWTPGGIVARTARGRPASRIFRLPTDGSVVPSLASLPIVYDSKLQIDGFTVSDDGRWLVVEEADVGGARTDFQVVHDGWHVARVEGGLWVSGGTLTPTRDAIVFLDRFADALVLAPFDGTARSTIARLRAEEIAISSRGVLA